MNFKKTCLVSLLFFCAITWVTCGSAFSKDINWYSYEKGLEAGKAEGKKIMLFFTGEFCGYCTKMKQTTFKDSRVTKYLDENFVCILMDYDKARKWADAYKIRSIPACWFLTEEGKKIIHRPGYLPAEKFLPLLKYIQTESFKKMTFQKFTKSMK